MRLAETLRRQEAEGDYGDFFEKLAHRSRHGGLLIQETKMKNGETLAVDLSAIQRLRITRSKSSSTV